MSESRDVAIIGMSCAFPGSPNVREYWRTIRDAKQNAAVRRRSWA